MSLLKKSKILLLYEATSSLDSESEVKIRDTITNLNLNHFTTVMYISHKEDLLKNASNIIKLQLQKRMVKVCNYTL